MKIFLPAVLSLAAALSVTPITSAQGGSGGPASPPPPQSPPSAARLFDLGKLSGSTYANEHFGISFTAPKGWTIIDPVVMKAMAERARELYRDEKNAAVKRGLEESVERTTPLFSAAKVPPGTAGAFNATLVCAAERIPTAVIKTPRDFYTTLLHSMKLSQEIDIEVVEPFKVKRIGALNFGSYTLKIRSNHGVMMQKQLISIKPPYAVGIVFTYVEESDAGVFDEVVRSIKTR